MTLEQQHGGPLDRPSSLSAKSATTLTTVSGVTFDLLEPTVEMVRLADITTGLSNQCRFNGQVSAFYSIAQHSVLVSEEAERRAILQRLSPRSVLEVAFMGLLHDAAEAYVGDIISPLKHLLPRFSEIEDRVQDTILKALNVRWRGDLEDLIDGVDKGMFAQECISLRGRSREWARDSLVTDLTQWLPAKPILSALGPNEAAGAFMKRYRELDAWQRRLQEPE